MNKMQMAHEYALEMLKETLPTGSLYGDDANRVTMSIVESAWALADAMQAEAEKRVNKERPEVLLTKDKDGKCLHFHHEFGHKKCMDCGASLEEWQPDWSQAPDDAIGWMLFDGSSTWLGADGYLIEDAPSFGFTGSHIVERPQ